MSKKLFVANWKSNKTAEEVKEWLDNFSPYIGLEKEVVIAPPYPFLHLVKEKIANNESLSLAVQDLSAYPAGSYTGEVCTRNLEGLEVKYAILGHSERRRYLGETHLDVANKVSLAVESGMTPIVCVDQEYIEDQALVIESELLPKCIVAYEPLSAIGTGEPLSGQAVLKVVKIIKKYFGEIQVLYGGSVTADNVHIYNEVTDGVLVGGASLDPEQFINLIQTG